MKILFLTQTTERGPSSRVRGYQMAEQLRRLGAETAVSPGIGAWFYPLVYNHSLSILKIPFYFLASLKRWLQISWMKKFDVVVLQKPVFPHVYPFLAVWLKHRGIRFVFDFDDAIFLRDPTPKLLPAILSRAAAVVAGNTFLRNYAICFNPRCVVIPSTIDTFHIQPKKKIETDGAVRLGWIGSRSTLEQLESIREPLTAFLEKENKVKLVIVCDHLPKKWKELAGSGKVEFKKWSLVAQSNLIDEFDIGLAPLKPGPWSEGKCGYKLLQYLAHALPVVASPVGVHLEMVREGKNGYLAASPEEWREKLALLLSQKSKWEQMGRHSRHIVEQDYSLATHARRFYSLLEELCKEKTAKKR